MGILAEFTTQSTCGTFGVSFLGLSKSLAADMISWFHALDAYFFIVGFDVPVFQWDKSLNKGSECVVT
jgi:hypothetical protein